MNESGFDLLYYIREEDQILYLGADQVVLNLVVGMDEVCGVHEIVQPNEGKYLVVIRDGVDKGDAATIITKTIRAYLKARERLITPNAEIVE